MISRSASGRSALPRSCVAPSPADEGTRRFFPIAQVRSDTLGRRRHRRPRMGSRTEWRARSHAALLATAAASVSLLSVTGSALAYKVCTDPNAPCVHEDMAQAAWEVLPSGEAKQHLADLRGGAGHEDVFDHIYGYEAAGIFSDSFLIITHFWDADNGPNDPVGFGPLDYPNSLQKARQLWSLALGAYAN